MVALGTLLGTRVLTGFIPPALFGAVSLALGISALAINMACTPQVQALLRFYPGAQQLGETGLLQGALRRNLRRVMGAALAIMTLSGVAYGLTGNLSPGVMLLVELLFVAECLRAVRQNALNAARSHRLHALWMAGEAWLRPLMATAAVLYVSRSAEAVLAGYVAATFILLALCWRAGAVFVASTPATASGKDAQVSSYADRMWRYALPLIPLGLVDWTNGLSDRYIIGGLLTLKDAGLYAAAYGLASRPFLMLGTSVELVVRPLYQAAVSAGQHRQAQRLLALWLAAVLGFGVVGVAVVCLWKQPITSLLLGAGYGAAAALMPMIAAGYVLLIASYVFERVCYAHGKTNRVLLTQTFTAAGGVTATLTCTHLFGIIGAAAAVPIYFSIQLLVSIWFAYKTLAGLAETDPQPSASD